MPNLKKVAVLSIAALIAQLILTKWIYPIIGKTTQTMFAIGDYIPNPVTGIGGTQIGDKILGYTSGFMPFSLGSTQVWIAMAIGAFALVFAGFWIYEQRYFKVWQGKNLMQRIFAILLYGHIVLYALLLLLKWGVPNIALNLALGVGLNLVFVSALLALSVKYFDQPKV